MFHLIQNLVRWASSRGEMTINILLVGLDGAGKTTLAHGLKGELPPDTIVPTMGFNFHRRDDGRRKVKFTDLGGGGSMRKLWPGYLGDAHGVVFVVDSADTDRMQLAAECLRSIGADGALRGKPLVVFSNKRDLRGSLPADEVSAALGVDAALAEAGLAEYAVVEGSALPGGGGVESAPPKAAHPSVRQVYDWLIKRIGSRYKEIQASVEAAEAERAKRKPKKSAADTQKRLEAIRARRRKEEEEEEARKKLAGAGAAPAAGGEGDQGPVRSPASISPVPKESSSSSSQAPPPSSLSPLPPIAPREGSPAAHDASNHQAALPGQTNIV